MQVVGGYRLASYVDFAYEREPPSDSLLKGRDFWKEPTRAPEIRLLLESDDPEVRQGPTRECGLPMVGRGRASALGQFFEFAPERVIHLQLLRYFPCNVEVVRPLRVQIGFLQEQDVGLCACEEFDHTLELQTAVDIPIHDPDGIRRAEQPPGHREVSCFDFLCLGHNRSGLGVELLYNSFAAAPQAINGKYSSSRESTTPTAL